MATDQKQFYCAECEKNTLHARHRISEIWGCALTILTFGLFLPIWLLMSIGGAMTIYRCQVCGAAPRTGQPFIRTFFYYAVIFIIVVNGFAMVVFFTSSPDQDRTEQTSSRKALDNPSGSPNVTKTTSPASAQRSSPAESDKRFSSQDVRQHAYAEVSNVILPTLHSPSSGLISNDAIRVLRIPDYRPRSGSAYTRWRVRGVVESRNRFGETISEEWESEIYAHGEGLLVGVIRLNENEVFRHPSYLD